MFVAFNITKKFVTFRTTSSRFRDRKYPNYPNKTQIYKNVSLKFKSILLHNEWFEVEPNLFLHNHWFFLAKKRVFWIKYYSLSKPSQFNWSKYRVFSKHNIYKIFFHSTRQYEWSLWVSTNIYKIHIYVVYIILCHKMACVSYHCVLKLCLPFVIVHFHCNGVQIYFFVAVTSLSCCTYCTLFMYLFILFSFYLCWFRKYCYL